VQWYVVVLRRYAQFDGRAHRPEFWWFTLWSFIVSLALSVLELALGLGNDWASPLTSVYALLVLVPTLAVGARRLHDTGRTGWWQLLLVIPLVGLIILIVWWAREGDREPNRWGPRPIGGPAPQGGWGG
jgi:uncharacterized membrane protein YhaH (DUF805 family)